MSLSLRKTTISAALPYQGYCTTASPIQTVRFFTMSAADFLEDYFEDDLVKAAMASPGIIGTALGVYSPGSAYILLPHVMGDVDGIIGAWGLARGGMGAISNAIAGAVKEHGGEIRTQAGVHRILVKSGKAVGVALENGDEIHAKIVVSNLDAKRTFTKAMDRKDLPPGILEKASWRLRQLFYSQSIAKSAW